MENSADENALLIGAVEDDVLLMLETPVPGVEVITETADPGRSGDPSEAILQVIKIAVGLFFSPGFERIIRDFE